MAKQSVKLNKAKTEEQLKVLIDWVTDQVKKNDPPRMSDVVDYCYRILGFTQLKISVIRNALRLHPAYVSKVKGEIDGTSLGRL